MQPIPYPHKLPLSTLEGERVLGRTRQLVRGLCKASIPLGGARCGAKDCGSSGGGAPRSRCCAATPLHRAYHVTALGLMTLQGRAGQQDPTRTGSTARSAHPAHVSDSAPRRGAGPSRPSSSSSPGRVCLDPRAGLPGLPRPLQGPRAPCTRCRAVPRRAQSLWAAASITVYCVGDQNVPGSHERVCMCMRARVCAGVCGRDCFRERSSRRVVATVSAISAHAGQWRARLSGMVLSFPDFFDSDSKRPPLLGSVVFLNRRHSSRR